MNFIFRAYNSEGEQIFTWEGQALEMSDFLEKFWLFLSNRKPNWARLSTDLAV